MSLSLRQAGSAVALGLVTPGVMGGATTPVPVGAPPTPGAAPSTPAPLAELRETTASSSPSDLG